MPIASLSRWTMSYFAAALVCLFAAEAMMVAGISYPAYGLAEPATLITVHLLSIGWLSLVMAGALLQFVPVLVARPLSCPRLALPALALTLGGLAGLCAGFASVSGMLPFAPELLPLSGLVLLAGFSLLGIMLAITLLRSRPLTLLPRFVLVGLAALAATGLSGFLFACILAGHLSALPFAALLTDGLSLHAMLGLGGWLSFTAFGVSYKLLAMFMMTPDTERRTTQFVLVGGTLSLGLAAGAFFFITLEQGRAGLAFLAMTGLALVTLLYGGDMISLYRARRRKALELNMLASIVAFAALGLCALLLPIVLLCGAPEPWVAALVFLLVFGWLSGLTLAQLTKIVSFMTWLEVFGPLLGRVAPPRVADLLNAKRARHWFFLYFVGVMLGTVALAVQAGSIFQLASLLCLAGTAGIVVELVRIRQLAELIPASRTAGGVPRLFLPQPIRKGPVHGSFNEPAHPRA
ncbi:hypothetical protein AB4Z40_27465 [Bosea sp. 2YAB26]|uniref:hypothetical protein n=1 Tax=Bosea sp. 2YAB26 TaxID=3237478 RepID=UPI003F8F5B4A